MSTSDSTPSVPPPATADALRSLMSAASDQDWRALFDAIGPVSPELLAQVVAEGAQVLLDVMGEGPAARIRRDAIRRGSWKPGDPVPDRPIITGP